jgi:hypothetical protein
LEGVPEEIEKKWRKKMMFVVILVVPFYFMLNLLALF